MLTERQIETVRRWLAEREAEMLALLEELAAVNSYTGNKQGVDAVGRLVRDAAEAAGLRVSREPQADCGDNLVARTPACSRHTGQALLCGHMDTVFPPEDGFLATRRQGDRLTGPGVADMKGGLVVGLYALRALDAAGALDDLPAAFVFNSDEETGSARSTALIQAEAGRSAFAFVFECGGLGGEVVTGRKGRQGYTLKARGRAGHAGNLKGPKASAILALARKIVALEALNDPAAGLSVNVGTVRGGMGPNTVPDSATAEVDCRFVRAADGDALPGRVREIAERPDAPGTTCSAEPGPGRPAMEPSPANRALLREIQAAGQALDIPVAEEQRGGVSDANTIAACGVPVVDGLGPCGDLDHSHDEYLLTPTLTRRAALAAVALARCWQAARQGG
jgi:glutamate carboxypeptidase